MEGILKEIGEFELFERTCFKGCDDFWSKNPESLLKIYCSYIKRLLWLRHKIKNPINLRTGDPLKTSTLLAYQSNLNKFNKDVKNLKLRIRVLVFHGSLGRNKTRARWIRERNQKRAEKAKAINYTKGLCEVEKKYVEIYSGNPTFAARRAGYSGNYIHVRKIGHENLKELRIKKALKQKKIYQMIQLGVTLIPGEGSGDGKPFKVQPDQIKGKRVIYLESYYSDIFKRLEERIKKLGLSLMDTKKIDTKMTNHIKEHRWYMNYGII